MSKDTPLLWLTCYYSFNKKTMNSTLEDIKNRLIRWEKLDFIALKTWVSEQEIRLAFNLNKCPTKPL